MNSKQADAVASGQDILQAVGATRTSVDWHRSTPWWFFLSGFVRLGWRTSHVFFAALGIWSTHAGLWAIGLLLGQRSVRFTGPAQGTVPEFTFVSRAWWSDLFPFSTGWLGSPNSITTSEAVSVVSIAYWLIVLIWLAIVWGFFGGIITRRSVIELGVRTTIGWTSAIKLVAGRLRSMVEAVSLPAIATFGLCLVPLFLGLLSHLGSFGEVTSAIGMLFCVILVIPVAWLLLLVVFGYPLLVAAIVSEKDSDAFEGLSRAAAYLFQRPMTIILALLVGGVTTQAVFRVVGLAYQSSFGLLTKFYLSTAGDNPLSTQAGRQIWNLSESIVQTIILAIPVSMFWAAVAATYLVVRREVDQTEYDNLDLQEVGSPLALPPTNYGDSGVLEIAKQGASPLATTSEMNAPASTQATQSKPEVTVNDSTDNSSS